MRNGSICQWWWVDGRLGWGGVGQRRLQHHSMDRPHIWALRSVTLVNLGIFPGFSPGSWRVVQVLCLFCVFFSIAVERSGRLQQQLLLRSHFKPDATASVLKQKSLLTKTTQLPFLFYFALINENLKNLPLLS